MDLIGSWYTSVIKNDSEEFYKNVGWFSFPKIDGSDADPNIQFGTVGNQFVSFNCKGEKLKAAFEFAALFSSEEAVSMMIDYGKIPPVKGVEGKISGLKWNGISADKQWVSLANWLKLAQDRKFWAAAISICSGIPKRR